jgi:site-specific recombinase XerD
MRKVITLPTQTGDAAPLIVDDAVDEFLDRDWSPNTQRSFTNDLTRFVDTFRGQLVADVTPADLRDYLNGLVSKRDPNKPVSAATYNRHYGTLTNMFGWLQRQEEIDANPLAKVDRRKESERLPRPMTREQVDAFFARVEKTRDRALFSLLYRSGLRIAEALALDIEHVKLGDGTLRIVGKGDRERIGYLSEETVKLFRRYLRERGRPKSGALFIGREGRLSYARSYQLFRLHAEGLEDGDKPLTIHQLRHSFGSERAGKIDTLVLRDLMGHRNVRTTERYARVNPEAAKKAFQEFEREQTAR